MYKTTQLNCLTFVNNNIARDNLKVNEMAGKRERERGRGGVDGGEIKGKGYVYYPPVMLKVSSSWFVLSFDLANSKENP